MGGVISSAEATRKQAEESVELRRAQLQGLKAGTKSTEAQNRIEDTEGFLDSKLLDLQNFLAGIIEEAKAQLGFVNNIEEQTASEDTKTNLVQNTKGTNKKAVAAKKKISVRFEEFEKDLEKNTEDAIREVYMKGDVNNEGITGIVNRVRGMFSDYNTLEAEQKVWQDYHIMEVFHTSTGAYVIKSGKGYFPNQHVPALKMLKVLELLGYCALANGGSNRKEIITEIDKQFEAAWWEGVDPNTNQLKKGFLVLRTDEFAHSLKSYNDNLADMIDISQNLVANRASSEVDKNIFAAISNLCVVCSMPDKPPYHVSTQEQGKCLKAVRACLNFLKQELLNPR